MTKHKQSSMHWPIDSIANVLVVAFVCEFILYLLKKIELKEYIFAVLLKTWRPMSLAISASFLYVKIVSVNRVETACIRCVCSHSDPGVPAYTVWWPCDDCGVRALLMRRLTARRRTNVTELAFVLLLSINIGWNCMECFCVCEITSRPETNNTKNVFSLCSERSSKYYHVLRGVFVIVQQKQSKHAIKTKQTKINHPRRRQQFELRLTSTKIRHTRPNVTMQVRRQRLHKRQYQQQQQQQQQRV